MSLLRSVVSSPHFRRRFLCSNGGTTSSHPDFERVVRKPSTTTTSSSGDIHSLIQQRLDESKVVLFMKGLPSQPQCGFSWKTVQILNAIGVEYKAFNVLSDENLRNGIKTFSQWPTIPQLFIDGEFIGGCDIVESMARNGELQQTLKEAGILKGEKEEEQQK